VLTLQVLQRAAALPAVLVKEMRENFRNTKLCQSCEGLCEERKSWPVGDAGFWRVSAVMWRRLIGRPCKPS
jgi:hypothetical protein